MHISTKMKLKLICSLRFFKSTSVFWDLLAYLIFCSMCVSIQSTGHSIYRQRVFICTTSDSQLHILPCFVLCHHQESRLSVLCMLAVLVVAALSISRGVSSFEKVNWVMVPTLLLSVAFSFYWAIFLPYASQGIVHLFTPDWGMCAWKYQAWRYHSVVVTMVVVVLSVQVNLRPVLMRGM